MISSSRIYLTCPVCLSNRRSVPICLPPPLFFILSSASHHLILSDILQYSIFISGSRWSIKNQSCFPKNKFQHFVLSTGVPSCPGTLQVASQHFLTPGFQIVYLTAKIVFSKLWPSQIIPGWNTLHTWYYTTSGTDHTNIWLHHTESFRGVFIHHSHERLSFWGYVRKLAQNDYYLRHIFLYVRPSVLMEQLGFHWADFN
jgi:hypothetical protein